MRKRVRPGSSWGGLALVELPAAQDEPGQGLEAAQDVDRVAAADRRLEQAGIGPAQYRAGRAHGPEQGGDPGIATEGQGRGLARVAEDGTGEARQVLAEAPGVAEVALRGGDRAHRVHAAAEAVDRLPGIADPDRGPGFGLGDGKCEVPAAPRQPMPITSGRARLSGTD